MWVQGPLNPNPHRTHIGGCQNYGLSLGPYYYTAPIIYGTQKGTLILRTTHIVTLKGILKGSLFGHMDYTLNPKPFGLSAAKASPRPVEPDSARNACRADF